MKQSRVSSAPLIWQEAKAFVRRRIVDNPPLWDCMIVFLGALFLLLSFPFYPPLLAVALALFAGILASKWPPLGMVLGVVFAFPAIAFQSTIFAWIMLPIIAVIIFTMFRHWNITSFLEILIFAPFAPYPFSILGGMIFFLLALFALYLGSKRSLMVSIPAVFLILLLSSLWMAQNSVFMPLSINLYSPQEAAVMNAAHAAPAPTMLISQTMASVSGMFDPANFSRLNAVIGKIVSNIAILLVNDSALLQLAVWAAVLFLVAVIPGVLRKFRYRQTAASLALLLVPLAYMEITRAYGYMFDNAIWYYVGATILLIFVMERYNITVTRERLLYVRERAKKFGKFGLVDLEESTTAGSLADVGNYEQVKEELKRVIMLPLQHLGVAYTYGIAPPNGVLLFGPPGTGKTMLMTALAKELGYEFYYVKTSELMSRWYGETEKNVTELFDIARKSAPCILFFDEVDAIGKRRETATEDQAQRVLSIFLQELDGFRSSKRAIVIGATNIPHMLDPALLRPGRFDTIIYMPLPDKEGRKKIFEVHTKKLPLADDVDIGKLAEKTERFSGADIANVCQEAKRSAAQSAMAKGKIVPITMKDFLSVLKAVKPSVSLTELENYERFRMDYERSYRKEAVGAEGGEAGKEGKVMFEDVVNLEEVKKLLKENIELPLLRPELLKEYKLRALKGILLYGPPGCGKTMIVKAAANELGVAVQSVSGADLLRKGYEYSIQVLKETFNRARENAPSIIFIDELDTLSEQSIFGRSVIGQLLVEIDGMKETKNVMFIGTSNKPWLLDPAMLRPGRFDKVIYISLPNDEVRQEILKKSLSGIRGFDTVDFSYVVKHTAGYSGADIVAVCDEVKRELVRLRMEGKEANLTADALKSAAKKVEPSVPSAMLKQFEKFHPENHGA